LIFLREKIPDILPINPTEFSVYNVMVNSCFSIVLFFQSSHYRIDIEPFGFSDILLNFIDRIFILSFHIKSSFQNFIQFILNEFLKPMSLALPLGIRCFLFQPLLPEDRHRRG